MPSHTTYCRLPCFSSARIDVAGWQRISSEYAMLAWLYRSVALGTWSEMPSISFKDGEMIFHAPLQSVIDGLVPSESQILAAAGNIATYHFTGDELSIVECQDSLDRWLVAVYPTNNVEPAPTPIELGAYVLAFLGFWLGLVDAGVVLPDSQELPVWEMFLPTYRYDSIDVDVPNGIGVFGLDDYQWDTQQAQNVASDLTTLWVAATPSS